jgi:hypothetical protein
LVALTDAETQVTFQFELGSGSQAPAEPQRRQAPQGAQAAPPMPQACLVRSVTHWPF